MKVSTKGRYALRMLLDLSIHQDGGYVSLSDICSRQDISKKYLEQIVSMLSKDGLLRTNRGNRGGYMLTKPVDKYTVGDILRATEGSLAPVSYLDYQAENECSTEENMTHYVWQGLYEIENKYLDSITLADIIEHGCEKPGDDYYI